MSKKQVQRTYSSPLEFKALSDTEAEAMVGGQAPPTPRTGIRELDDFLSNLREEGEGRFRKRFPELTPIVFPFSG